MNYLVNASVDLFQTNIPYIWNIDIYIWDILFFKHKNQKTHIHILTLHLVSVYKPSCVTSTAWDEARFQCWQSRPEDEGLYLFHPRVYHITWPPSVQPIRSGLLLLFLLENSLGAADSLQTTLNKGSSMGLRPPSCPKSCCASRRSLFW